jgi:small-conductance mechanosensitive channel
MGKNWFNLDRIPAYQSGHVLTHLVVIVALAVIAHFLVRLVHFISDELIRRSAAKKTPVGFVTQQPKFSTLTGLVSSALTFIIYFFAIGFVLNEFKVDLTVYLASASVIGLAVGFGSQGLVQDVVSGLTLIFSDALDVGDLIEVSGQIGRVERVGLRFTTLINFYNQEVFVPNRTIGNVSRFPLGGIYAYADIQVPASADAQKVMRAVGNIARGLSTEFSAIVLSDPVVGKVQTATPGGWNFLRVQFKIWPGQGSLIEIPFRQQVVTAMKVFDPQYVDWMVTVTYRALIGSDERPAHL